MKMSSQMLQNLLCLCKKKTHIVFFVFHFKQLYFMNAMVYQNLFFQKFALVVSTFAQNDIFHFNKDSKHFEQNLKLLTEICMSTFFIG